MASISALIALLLVLLVSFSSSSHASNATYVLPIIKDNVKSQYFTSFLVGTPPTRVYLVVDLGSKWSWFTCASYGFNKSSTFESFPCYSEICNSYNTFNCIGDYCRVEAYSPWVRSLYDVVLSEDVVTLLTYNSTKVSKALLPDFPFACADDGPLRGLSSYTKGVLTLANNLVSLHSQVSSNLKVPHKFAICLPANSSPPPSGYNGAMYFGGGPYHLPPRSSIDLSKSLITTPLLVNPFTSAPFSFGGEPSEEYYINVTSIKVDGTPLNFDPILLLPNWSEESGDGSGGVKISSIDPYTMLHSDIYKALVDVFVSKAVALNMTRVAPVAPFGVCFDAKTILNIKTGLRVPIIDLILDGTSPLLHDKKARWRIYGANSMVKASKSVYCLAFVDAGLARTPIVIGAKQMEDNLVEFDLESNQLGITSSLLRLGRSCSQFRGV